MNDQHTEALSEGDNLAFSLRGPSWEARVDGPPLAAFGAAGVLVAGLAFVAHRLCGVQEAKAAGARDLELAKLALAEQREAQLHRRVASGGVEGRSD